MVEMEEEGAANGGARTGGMKVEEYKQIVEKKREG